MTSYLNLQIQYMNYKATSSLRGPSRLTQIVLWTFFFIRNHVFIVEEDIYRWYLFAWPDKFQSQLLELDNRDRIILIIVATFIDLVMNIFSIKMNAIIETDIFIFEMHSSICICFAILSKSLQKAMHRRRLCLCSRTNLTMVTDAIMRHSAPVSFNQRGIERCNKIYKSPVFDVKGMLGISNLILFFNHQSILLSLQIDV